MKIQCLTPFLDERDRFETGDIRTVDAARGAYFVGNGWALDLDAAPAPAVDAATAPATLDVQSGNLTSGDSNG